MKKFILITTMIILHCSISIRAFGQTITADNTTITALIKKPLHKSQHMSYIVDRMNNGLCSLIFMKALDNAEIKIYQYGILIDQKSGSFREGENYTLDLQGYGQGEYTIEVYCNNSKIFSSFEVI